MNQKIVTFGEIMLRLAPEGYTRFTQAQKFNATYGGGEANVALSLAMLGLDAAFVTKLPNNEIADSAVNTLRGFGVDTSKIVRGGRRMGIYFLEKGASQRASKVIYDREGSSISEARAADFNFDEIFHGVSWFHFTGITPALSDEVAAISMKALRAAKEKGITVSCDINYRKKLWTREKAGQVMSSLMPYVDLCISNEEDAKDVFGISAKDSDITAGKISHDQYYYVAKELEARFGFKSVAITLRSSISASRNLWCAMLYEGGKSYFAREYDIDIVDRVGGGDSFGAGLIYSKLCGYDSQKAIEFATAASCLKHTIEGDLNLASLSEIETLAAGDGSGRVRR